MAANGAPATMAVGLADTEKSRLSCAMPSDARDELRLFTGDRSSTPYLNVALNPKTGGKLLPRAYPPAMVLLSLIPLAYVKGSLG
jgi:hypothetical protein